VISRATRFEVDELRGVALDEGVVESRDDFGGIGR
jgi:hypothetical protein